MHTTWDGYRQDLGASTAAGLTHGVSLPYQRLEGFAESEMRYRQGRMLAEATRPQPGLGPEGRHWEKSGVATTGRVTRWTTWLSSVLPRRSLHGSGNSGACAN